ncbi:U-box domain-containing protein 12-like [Zingiber officinale]|uniref:ARM repeat superfamily protein n=1 Tax=Zingiber officinale TaxID=94328 RepID=A0A8J5KSH2_ZINOF|nr:U-box domain-containing protein 12-like [Zingiber officinale]KAG6487175.1 hypothetical protein ZIOFF_055758 [Zingiber officinale]
MVSEAVDAVAECLAQAESEEEEARATALQTLSALTKLSSHNRDLVALTDGALPLLLSLSDSPLALSTLLHLSLNPNLKKPIASVDGLLGRLSSLLLCPSTSPQTAALTASLVCSLAMHDKNKAPLGVAGAVEAVVETLVIATTSPSEGAVARHLLSSLAELAQFHGNCTLAVRAGAVPVLVRILDGQAEDLVGTASVVLARLASFEEGMGAIREVPGVAWVLLEAVRKGCVVGRESAMEVLVRLVGESRELTEEVAASEDTSILLADLSIRGSAKLRDQAALLMKLLDDADFKFAI